MYTETCLGRRAHPVSGGITVTPVSQIIDLCRDHWKQATARQPVARIWRKDHTLWKASPDEIINRLGWLDLPTSMRTRVRELTRLSHAVQDRSIRDIILLGMGGSSLCSELFSRAFHPRKNFPRLTVLDSTLPASVIHVAKNIIPEKTIFVVASKSGATIEVLALYAFFHQLMQKTLGDRAGQHFIAITDPATPLLTLANKHNFLRTFLNPSDVGGRYSVLSYFGLVPAALIGLDINTLLARGREGARICGLTAPPEKNPGALLGLAMGCLALAGRDKLTLITTPRLASFGLWAEQLIAESTGKANRGIIPIAGEPLAVPDAYRDDRFFVYLRLRGDDTEPTDRFSDALLRAGAPLHRIHLEDIYDLGREFFRWEFAAAIAGACLQINPFDQPNVAESKSITAQLLASFESEKKLPRISSQGSLSDLLNAARPRDYLAIIAFARETPELNSAFLSLRQKLLTHHKLPTTLGYGPRFLHSTGQLHKGGPDNGLFLQIVRLGKKDIRIPGKPYTFATLAAAQAIGDFQALKAHNRRVIRIPILRDESPSDKLLALLPET